MRMERIYSALADAQKNHPRISILFPAKKSRKELSKMALSFLTMCNDRSRLQGFPGCIDEEVHRWPLSLAGSKTVQCFQRRVNQVNDVWVIFFPRRAMHTGLKNCIEKPVYSITSLGIFQFVAVDGLNSRIPWIFVLNLNLKFLESLYAPPQNLGYDKKVYERG